MSKIMTKLLTGFVLACCFAIFPFGMKASAAQIQQPAVYPQIYIEGYEVTNESITPGMDFVLTVKIRNYSKNVNADNVVVYMTNPEGIVPKYGTVNAVYIERIEADSTEEVSFQYKANSSLKVTEINFAASVTSGSSSSGVQLRVPVGRLTDFSVEKFSVPEVMTAGAIGYASALMENVSDAGISDCVLVARSNDSTIASANIGTISAKTTKTQYVPLYFEEEGIYPIEIVLLYRNADGIEKEFIIASESIQVYNDGTSTSSDAGLDDMQEQQDESTSLMGDSGKIMVVCVSGVLLIGLLCAILMLLYRRK